MKGVGNNRKISGLTVNDLYNFWRGRSIKMAIQYYRLNDYGLISRDNCLSLG
jgi:hypothetical protein